MLTPSREAIQRGHPRARYRQNYTRAVILTGVAALVFCLEMV